MTFGGRLSSSSRSGEPETAEAVEGVAAAEAVEGVAAAEGIAPSAAVEGIAPSAAVEGIAPSATVEGVVVDEAIDADARGATLAELATLLGVAPAALPAPARIHAASAATSLALGWGSFFGGM
jgi:hypothetical protein